MTSASNVVVGLQFTGFENHLQVRVGAVLALALFLDSDNLLEDLQVVAAQKCSANNHHVDLIGTRSNRLFGVHEFDLER